MSLSYSWSPTGLQASNSSIVTIRKWDGELVVPSTPPTISNNVITVMVEEEGQYRIKVVEGQVSETKTTFINDPTNDNTSNGGSGAVPANPKTVIVESGNEARPTGANVVFWIRGTVKPNNMQNNDIWFKTVPTVPVDPEETVDTTDPSAPTNLIASDIDQTSFTLTWSSSVDNVGVSSYDILLNGTLKTTTATSPANISGLTSGTTYNVTVRAKDVAGNTSAISQALSVSTSSVAVTSPRHSIWHPNNYPYTMIKETSEPLTVANSFYSYGSEVSEWRVVGMRLWVPEGLTMSGTATFSVWKGLDTLISSVPIASKTLNSINVGWNEIIWDSAVETDAGETVWLGYRSSAGHYIGGGSPTSNFVPSTDGSKIVLSADSEKRAQFKYDSGNPVPNSNVFGIDVIYDEGP